MHLQILYKLFKTILSQKRTVIFATFSHLFHLLNSNELSPKLWHHMMCHAVQHSLQTVHCQKNGIQRNIRGTCGDFLTFTPKLQTVAENFTNVFDSPIIEF